MNPHGSLTSLRVILAGQVVLTLSSKAAAQEQQKERELGCLKGQIWMVEDFDATLEDFKDYILRPLFSNSPVFATLLV